MEPFDRQQKEDLDDIRARGNGIHAGLEKPQQVYQGPLKKIGEALRRPPARSGEPIPQALQGTTRLWVDSESPKREISNSFSRAHSGSYTPSPASSGQKDHAALDFGQSEISDETGIIVAPATRTEAHNKRNTNHSAGTSLLLSLFSNPRTRAPFKPQKASRGTSSWQLKQYAEATLGSGSLRKAVKLPEGEDKDEWLAVNG